MQAESVKNKIVLLGDGAVGKTSLVRRFVVDQFDDRYIATIGAKVMKKDLRLSVGAGMYDFTMMIWDVIGQKGFHGVQTSAFDQSRGMVLVADLTRPETAESIKAYWIPRVREVVGDVPMVILGNKVDIVENKPSAEGVVSALAAELGCRYFLTSAKTGENVENGFGSFARTLIEAGERHVPGRPVAQETIVGPPTIATVADWIMVDFCKGFGGVEAGTPILHEQFRRAGFDVNKPTKEGLLKAVDMLSLVEISFRTEKEVEESRTKRVMWVDSLKEEE